MSMMGNLVNRAFTRTGGKVQDDRQIWTQLSRKITIYFIKHISVIDLCQDCGQTWAKLPDSLPWCFLRGPNGHRPARAMKASLSNS